MGLGMVVGWDLTGVDGCFEWLCRWVGVVGG